jgi:hypothetical protein
VSALVLLVSAACGHREPPPDEAVYKAAVAPARAREKTTAKKKPIMRPKAVEKKASAEIMSLAARPELRVACAPFSAPLDQVGPHVVKLMDKAAAAGQSVNDAQGVIVRRLNGGGQLCLALKEDARGGAILPAVQVARYAHQGSYALIEAQQSALQRWLTGRGKRAQIGTAVRITLYRDPERFQVSELRSTLDLALGD